jgi:hypothetical protein
MKRYAIALVLSAVFGLPAFAQAPATRVASPLAVGPPPDIAPHQTVVPGPTPTPGTPVLNTGEFGYYKSGGVLVGGNGYFPYDSGMYLLPGTDGLARSKGFYMMVPATGVGPDAPPGMSPSCGRAPRCFRR